MLEYCVECGGESPWVVDREGVSGIDRGRGGGRRGGGGGGEGGRRGGRGEGGEERKMIVGKQKTEDEVTSGDGSEDVCAADLGWERGRG